MKKFLTIIFSSIIAFSSFAYDVEQKAWLRDKNGKLKEEKIILKNLISDSKAETPFFKIVNGRSDDAISFSDKLGEKAANVLYHLQFARDYYSSHLESINLSDQTIIRIDMSDSFLSEYHWGHEKFSNNFNNAATIPPSDKFKATGVKDWNNEIWFRPSKEIKARSELERVGELMDNPGFKRPTQISYVERSASNLTNQVLNGSSSYAEFELGYLLGMLTFVELLPKGLKIIGKTHKRKMELDTAMIPEVIYHEYSHVALYDYLSFDEKTPVVEGIANYFAAKMLGYHKLGFKLGKFGKGLGGYSGKRTKKYEYSNETKEMSHSSFLLSMLWAMDEEIEDFDSIVFEARKYLDKDSDIKYDLSDALQKTIQLRSPGDLSIQLKFMRILNKYLGV